PDNGTTVTFEAFAPGSDCASDAAAYTSDPQSLTDNGDGTFSASSGDYTATAVGDYVWVISYSGNDTNNAIAAQGCPNSAADEISRVIPDTPTLVTSTGQNPDSDPAGTSVEVNHAISDSVTVSGGYLPAAGTAT